MTLTHESAGPRKVNWLFLFQQLSKVHQVFFLTNLDLDNMERRFSYATVGRAIPDQIYAAKEGLPKLVFVGRSLKGSLINYFRKRAGI